MAILTPHGPRFGRSSRRTARPWLPTLSARRRPTKSAVRRLLSGDFSPSPASGTCPLRLFEIGASAGLNLRFDHYRYEAADSRLAIPPPPCALPACGEG